jgi:hypothetical protein
MRSAIPLVALFCIALTVPALAQGRGNGGDKGGGPDKGAEQGQGQGQGKGKGQSQDQNEGQGHGQAQGRGQGNAQGGPQQVNVVVTDRDRGAVQTYYRNEFATGNCPPGLAKKNNGCLPPGQAKKLWSIGQPLPPALVFYPLPTGLLSTLTPPPPGYQYVRVDDDVLLMITATRIITSLVTNLGG